MNRYRFRWWGQPALVCAALVMFVVACSSKSKTGAKDKPPGPDTKAINYLQPPKAKPVKYRALGRPLWLAVAARPASKIFAVVTPETVRAYSWPSRKELWKQPAPRKSSLLAFSADGTRLAVLGDVNEPGGQKQLNVFEATTGKLLGEHRYGALSSPSSGRGGGRQPATTPTGLAPAPDGKHWWVVNAYGTWLAQSGVATFTAVKTGLPVARFTADQTSRAMWGYSTAKPVLRAWRGGKEIHAVTLPCHAQWHVADLDLDRLAAVCLQTGKPVVVRVFEISTNKLLNTYSIANPPSQMVFVAADRLLLLHTRPRQAEWLGAATGPKREAMAGDWKRIEVSPDGKHAAAVGGGAEVIALPSGKVLCDHQQLPNVVSLGFSLGGVLWALAFERRANQRFPKLAFARIALPSCQMAWHGAPITATATGSVVPQWLAKPRAFAIPASFANGGRGTAYVSADDPTRIHKLPGQPYRISTSEDGARLALGGSDSAELYITQSPPKYVRKLAPSNRIALCGGRTLNYTFSNSWTFHNFATNVMSGRMRVATQPDLHDCRDSRLVVVRTNLFVYDVANTKIVAELTTGYPVRALRLLPGGKQLLTNGGETGWRLVALP